MKDKKSANSGLTQFFCATVLLAVVLASLFWRSFLPDFVHFSNDGPLGEQNSAWNRLPGGFTGSWADINYLGTSGTATPSITAFLHMAFTPVEYAKFNPPITLVILGIGAWSFFRQLKLSHFAALMGALAAELNSTFFSAACWGVASQDIAIGMVFFALALIVGCRSTMSFPVRCARLALAGLCVGNNVMEAADIGALLSMLVALFAFVYALADGEGAFLGRAFRGIGRVAIVATFALFIAIQSVLALVGTNIQGVAGTSQDKETTAAQWDWATQWSLPKAETLGLIVPGLFGYRMDTPKDMMPGLQDSYRSGAYWGGVGRAPELDRYFDSDGKGPQPSGPGDYMRFTGGGNYCGIIVIIVAGWTVAQSLRKKGFSLLEKDRRLIWFWAIVMFFCILFAWGRFAPFYAVLYQLPYFSTIRNPAKFIIFFSVALVIVFGYGVDALYRRYLCSHLDKAQGIRGNFRAWWSRADVFERRWTWSSIGFFAASLLVSMAYFGQKPAMIAYLQKVGFSDADPTHENSAPAIAAFSFGQTAVFLLLLGIAILFLIFVISDYFAGRRGKIALALFAIYMVLDLGRANLPWIIHWNYKEKYEIDSLNPIVKFLQDRPYEHRVADLGFRIPAELGIFEQLYRVEWMQHQFPYYNIQSLDFVQIPRMPEDIKAFKEVLLPRSESGAPLIAREWQLTNTRYLLGPALYLAALNEQLDPGQHRFRILQRFNVLPRPGIPNPYGITQKQLAYYLPLEEDTAVPDPEGDFALFEFAGALPRAKLYSNWQVNTNDQSVLNVLGDVNFDPTKTVLVSTMEADLPAAATGENVGSVNFESAETKHIIFSAQTTKPSVLLLNDRYDPHWSVTVDGKPAQLLRCNFIMRGVYLPTPGNHSIVFDFSLPHRPLYITLTAFAVGLGLCGFLFYSSRRSKTAAN